MRMMDSQQGPNGAQRDIGQQLHALLLLAPAVHAELAARVGVGVTDLLALDHTTSAASELGVVELADLLKIRSASATVLVDRLVARGHLERAPHSTDGRRTSLHPTTTAHHEVGAALEPLIRELGDITGTLTPTEADVVLRVLREVNAALARFTEVSAAAAGGGQSHPDGNAHRENRDDSAKSPPQRSA